MTSHASGSRRGGSGLRGKPTKAYAEKSLAALKELTGVLGLLEQTADEGIDEEIQKLIAALG